jgi:hypothetical protein
LNKAISELSKMKEKAKSNQRTHPKDEANGSKMAQKWSLLEQEQMEEDVAMLRQILDNLLLFIDSRRGLDVSV